MTNQGNPPVFRASSRPSILDRLQRPARRLHHRWTRLEHVLQRLRHHALALQELRVLGAGNHDECRRDFRTRECLRPLLHRPGSLVLARHEDGRFEAANARRLGSSWRTDENRPGVALRKTFDQRLGAEGSLRKADHDDFVIFTERVSRRRKSFTDTGIDTFDVARPLPERGVVAAGDLSRERDHRAMLGGCVGERLHVALPMPAHAVQEHDLRVSAGTSKHVRGKVIRHRQLVDRHRRRDRFGGWCVIQARSCG